MAIYTRKSKFTTSGESIETQINLCRDYARERLNINDFTIYEDEGFSGGNINRPNFQRMLSEARLGKFDVIICYRLDRISRNVADFSKLINELEALNIKFVSIKEQFDTSTPMGRAMMNIAAVFAQLERETIAERVRDNMLELAKSGRWLGGITPTGFESKEEVYFDQYGVKRKFYNLSPVYRELEIIKTIYYKFLELQSLSDLENYLLQMDIKSKNNRIFNRSSLKIILSNPVYAVGDKLFYEYCRENKMLLADDILSYNGERGILTYNKYNENKGIKKVLRNPSQWIIALGNHKGIIPSKDWIKVQALLARNKKSTKRLGTSKYALLTSLLYCSHCRSPMRVSAKYKEGKPDSYYYICTKKDRARGEKCSCPNLNGIEADNIVINIIKSLDINEASFNKFLNQNNYSSQDTAYKLQDNTTIYKKQISKYQKSINNLTITLSQNEDSASSRYIIKEIEELHFKISSLEKKIINLSNQNDFPSDFKDRLSHIKSINSNIESLDIEFKKNLTRELISKILWDGETLEIQLSDDTI